MPTDLNYNASNGSIFVQPGGPGTELYYLGCYDSEDISAPQGDIEIDLCRKPDGSGRFDTISIAKAPPDLVTTSLTGLTGKTRDWLLRALCPPNLFFMRHIGGRADNPANYDSALVLRYANVSGKTFSGVVNRKESTNSTHSVDVQAVPPLIEINPVKAVRIPTAETQAANDIGTDAVGACASSLTPLTDPGDETFFVCDSAVAPAKGSVYLATDGATFTVAAALPFAAGKNVTSGCKFLVGKTTIRHLVGMEAPAAGQGMIAFSDDSGATWTTVNIGGAAAGHGAKSSRALFALSVNEVFLASALGYIYKSTNGGQTWTAKESGVIQVGDYNAIHFADSKNGWAVGAAGVVAVTHDGGEIWSAATVIAGGAALNTVWSWDGMNALVGTAGGKLFKTVDGGVIWNEVAGWAGSGTGSVRGLAFVDELIGYMIHNTAAPVGTILRTIDGGFSWAAITTPANSGLNSIAIVGWNDCWVAGEPNGGTAVVIKVYEE